MNEIRQFQRGYIFLKGGAWHLRYRQYEVNEDGSTTLVQRSHKLADCREPYTTKRSVRQLADEFLTPLNDGSLANDSTMPVTRFWTTRYLPYIKAQTRPSTFKGYQNTWKTYLQDRLNMQMRHFRTVDCERLLRQITHERDLTTTTLRHIKQLLSGIFRYAIRIGLLNGANPVQAACIPKARRGEDTHAYDLPQILKMLEILPQPAKAMVAVAAFAGLRRGELRALRIEDYDGTSLRIRRAAWEKHITEPKGKRGIGTVPLIPTAARILNEHLAMHHPRNYIFETFRGDPANLEGYARKVIRPMLKEAGIPWYGLHAFRRGLATNLYALGIADIVIQAILRHSDVSVTRQAYIKSDAADPRSISAMEMLEEAVRKQLEPETQKEREEDAAP